jgi:hypothetical protein
MRKVQAVPMDEDGGEGKISRVDEGGGEPKGR